jgi:RHS repeat-associated protein
MTAIARGSYLGVLCQDRHAGGDAAQSGAISNNGQSWMQTTVSGPGIIRFYWKVSSQLGDYVEFFIDSVRQARISGTTDWQGQSYTITGSGTHTLKWRYTKNSSGSGGSDCAWVDYVQSPSPTDWLTITYAYDSAGRRIEKAYDGQTVMKYLYDGSQIIAEYDGNNTLLHKYIYGPGIDQPICMIDVEHNSATYYYHFDGLGSVVALTNSAGSVVNLYEYSIFGEVSASDPNHPNRFMFTGREFDKDTGLYYYRARYYNPYIGRFLQTDPAGDGMNGYAYCQNSPINAVDPLGLRALLYPEWAVRAYRNVRNTDPVAPHYWAQSRLFNCAPVALANLYIAIGGDALTYVCDKMVETYQMYNNFFPEGPVINWTRAYFEDYLEVMTGWEKGGVDIDWGNNDPLNLGYKAQDHDWDDSGIDSLTDVAAVIKNLCCAGTNDYHFLNNAHDYSRAIRSRIEEGNPIIIAFRISNATDEKFYVAHHVVVVRYCKGAQSYDAITGQWVNTPYEIIDGGAFSNAAVYGTLYFTQKEFTKLVQDAADQAVLPGH